MADMVMAFLIGDEEMPETVVSKANTSGGSIWDSFTQAAGSAWDSTIGKAGTVVGSTIDKVQGGLVEKASTVLPNWATKQLGLQKTDQLAANTLVPANSNRVNTQLYATTGVPPSAEPTAAVSLIDMSGSSNLPMIMTVLVGGLIVFFLVRR